MKNVFAELFLDLLFPGQGRCREGKMERLVLHGNNSLGVNFCVAYDKHMKQTLAECAAILHLPTGLVIRPLSERIV